MEISFSTKEELYNRVKPALKAKKRELVRFGYRYLAEKDIWNYLIKTKWSHASYLSLSDVVNDIMQAEGRDVFLFLKEQRQKDMKTKDHLEII